MEFIPVASFADVERPEHYSPSLFKHRGNMSGVMPPPLHYIVYHSLSCVFTGLNGLSLYLLELTVTYCC